MRSVFKQSACALLLSLATFFANAQSDSLDSYIRRLKQSKAAGGSETAFMSIGSDFLYAQEYFEAGNYGSAAYSFEGVLRKDKNHPYANYQMAMALLKQNDSYKTRQAEAFLALAYQLQPGLADRFLKERPGLASIPTVESPVTPATQPVPNMSGGLDAYIDQIKYARSSGGAATIMNSAGLDAFYGIEYFDSGIFNSAETQFSLSLSKDPANPYVNYLKAVSMAAQGKSNAAKAFLAKALAVDPSLQERFTNDAAYAQKAWKKQQDAVSVKTETPAAPVKYGGALQYGNYTCHVSVWNGPNVSPAYRNDYKGYFALKKDGSYRWLDDGPTGRYAYNAATGRLDWTSGYFRASAPRITQYKKEGGYAHITIEYTSNLRWECGCKL